MDTVETRHWQSAHLEESNNGHLISHEGIELLLSSQSLSGWASLLLQPCNDVISLTSACSDGPSEEGYNSHSA